MVDKSSTFIGEATRTGKKLTDVLAKKLVFVDQRLVVGADSWVDEFRDESKLVVVHGGELENERIPEKVREKEGKNWW